MKGPQFVQYFIPVISALKELGNSGTPSEVREVIIKNLKIPDSVLNEQLKSGIARFDNKAAWARFYLSKAGYLDSSKRGVWTLTEKGINSALTEKDALELFRSVHGTFRQEEAERDEEEAAPPGPGNIYSGAYKEELLEIIRKLSPSGFEKLCQRLLREAGFQEVKITGRSGDEGIDGEGLLQINPLMSFKVLFQCKRYQGAVNPSQIRDFRGAMQGRADKGVFITTGSFSNDARKEAMREGVPPIELVDSERLISMFEDFKLGLKLKETYEIDKVFFEEFGK